MPHIHNRQCSGDHYGQPARFCDVLNLYEPKNIPFNALIVGPTNSGKTQYLVNQLRGPFWGKFDYIVLIWPTFVHNKTHDRFLDNDPYIFVVGCPQEEVEFWLKLKSYLFSGNKHAHYFGRLRCVERGHTGQLVSLGFSARHTGISFWVLTQQITSITKPFRENLAAIVLFYTPSGKTTKAIFEDYAGELSSEKYKEMIAKLKKIFFSSGICPLPSLRDKNIFNTAEQAAEQQAVNEVMQILEATRDSSNPSDFPVLLRNNGKAGSACFHGQIQWGIWHPTYSWTSKTPYRQGGEKILQTEAYLDSKTTETLMQSFLMLASKAIGMVVKVDDVEALQKDL